MQINQCKICENINSDCYATIANFSALNLSSCLSFWKHEKHEDRKWIVRDFRRIRGFDFTFSLWHWYIYSRVQHYCRKAGVHLSPTGKLINVLYLQRHIINASRCVCRKTSALTLETFAEFRFTADSRRNFAPVLIGIMWDAKTPISPDAADGEKANVFITISCVMNCLSAWTDLMRATADNQFFLKAKLR